MKRLIYTLNKQILHNINAFDANICATNFEFSKWTFSMGIPLQNNSNNNNSNNKMFPSIFG